MSYKRWSFIAILLFAIGLIFGLATPASITSAISVITYRIGSRALGKKAVAGLPAMVGTKGKVVSPLAPKGVVRIKGELWEAMSSGVDMDVGEEVVVVGQYGLRLIVDKDSSGNSKGTG